MYLSLRAKPELKASYWELLQTLKILLLEGILIISPRFIRFVIWGGGWALSE